MLTERELKVKEFMEDVFIPELHKMLRTANPHAYKQWNGNACLHTAIMGTKFLEILLPQYKWFAWEGIFKDFVMGDWRNFNHAWIFGTDRAEGRKLFIDMSSVVKERLFIETNVNAHPKDHPEYANQQEINRRRVDMEEAMRITDITYTHRTGEIMFQRLFLKCADRMGSLL